MARVAQHSGVGARPARRGSRRWAAMARAGAERPPTSRRGRRALREKRQKRLGRGAIQQCAPPDALRGRAGARGFRGGPRDSRAQRQLLPALRLRQQRLAACAERRFHAHLNTLVDLVTRLKFINVASHISLKLGLNSI